MKNTATAEVKVSINDMEIKLRNPEHFYTKITSWRGMLLAHTLPRISSSSWPGRLRSHVSFTNQDKGRKGESFQWKESSFTEKKQIKTMTRINFQRRDAVPSCLRPTAGQFSASKVSPHGIHGRLGHSGELQSWFLGDRLEWLCNSAPSPYPEP